MCDRKNLARDVVAKSSRAYAVAAVSGLTNCHHLLLIDRVPVGHRKPRFERVLMLSDCLTFQYLRPTHRLQRL